MRTLIVMFKRCVNCHC